MRFKTSALLFNVNGEHGARARLFIKIDPRSNDHRLIDALARENLIKRARLFLQMKGGHFENLL
jgi:hypothetical protein